MSDENMEVQPQPSTEPQPEPVQKVDAPPAPVAEPERVLPDVDLAVFLRASGMREDQTAGFRLWARQRRLSRQTMLQWKAKWDEFQRRPV